MKTDKVVDFIVAWLDDYRSKNKNIKGFAVGVSGGIDSAVVSTLCARTGADVLALEIPILGTEPEYARSKNHIKWLQEKYGKHVETRNVSMVSVFEEFKGKMPSLKPGPRRDLVEANLQARLRMVRVSIFGVTGILYFIR